MLATFWLLGLALVPDQTGTRPTPSALGRADWAVAPRLARGQELAYRGTFSEEAGSRVQHQRSYRFEVRYFVLDVPPKGADLAALTTLHERPASAPARDAAPSAARLERLRVDLDGRPWAVEPGVSLAVPDEGAPTVEVGPFVALPRNRPAVGQGWETNEIGRPVTSWRVAASEIAAGQTCFKIVATQQSPEWERPRADRPAWKRVDTLWVSPRTGMAVRVERVAEQREPARVETSRKSVLRYELDSDLTYPGRLADDRRQEIAQAFAFRDAARPMFAEPAKYGKQLVLLQKRIGSHLDTNPPTPYREAVQAVRRQVDAAARGEVVTVAYREPARPLLVTATKGEPAPDFVASEITGTGSGRLGQWKGRAVLLVFYQPSSVSAEPLLRFAQDVTNDLGRRVQVVGMCVGDDAEAALRQRSALKLTFPLLHGSGLRTSYGVDATPRMVLIDAYGTVRYANTGWGRETRGEMLAEIRQCLP